MANRNIVLLMSSEHSADLAQKENPLRFLCLYCSFASYVLSSSAYAFLGFQFSLELILATLLLTTPRMRPFSRIRSCLARFKK